MVKRVIPSASFQAAAKARKAPPNWVRMSAAAGGVGRGNFDAFAPRHDLHPPGVIPTGARLALDSTLVSGAVGPSTQWAAAAIAQSFAQGVQFLGYPYLAELAQRPEYRVISQTIAEEMTRKWLKFEAKGEDQKETRRDPEQELERQQPPEQPSAAPGQEDDQQDPYAEQAQQQAEQQQAQQEEEQEEQVDEEEQARTNAKQERITQLEDMFKALHVREACKTLVEQDGFFGRAHLYLDTGDTDNREELKLSIGGGDDALSKAKVNPERPLLRLKCVEAVWCYPTSYDSIDPLKPSWYKPERWFVMGKEVHVSRLLLLVGNEVPDLLKPAYSFGGLSMSQMAQPYINNWLQTRQSVNDLIQAFVVWGLKTNLAESLGLNGEQLFARLDLFNRLRNNRGIMAVDKDTEEFFNVTAPLSGLEQLQAQSQEHMAAVSRIPLVKLTGISPTGLNASSEGEIRVFYDTILGRQEWLLSPIVQRLMHFCMLSLWGEIDHDITFAWNPLWALDEKAQAEVEEVRARTAQIWIDTGVVDKMEERRRVAEAANSPYPGLDPNFEPDLQAEEEQGLVPKGGGGGLKSVLGEPGEEGGEEHEGPPNEDDDLDEPEVREPDPPRRLLRSAK